MELAILSQVINLRRAPQSRGTGAHTSLRRVTCILKDQPDCLHLAIETIAGIARHNES
jgi:hypothetical protein